MGMGDKLAVINEYHRAGKTNSEFLKPLKPHDQMFATRWPGLKASNVPKIVLEMEDND